MIPTNVRVYVCDGRNADQRQRCPRCGCWLPKYTEEHVGRAWCTHCAWPLPVKE